MVIRHDLDSARPVLILMVQTAAPAGLAGRRGGTGRRAWVARGWMRR